MTTYNSKTSDQREWEVLRVKLWSHNALDDPATVILDAETTGYKDPEFCSISVIDTRRDVLFDEIVRPWNPEKVLEKGRNGLCAADIHGLTPDKLDDKPTIKDVWSDLVNALTNRRVLIYNKAYDWDQVMLRESQVKHLYLPPVRNIECVMIQYAAYIGDWDNYHGNYRWQQLPGGDHSALGDVYATLDLLLKMAGRDDGN